jgi:phospholipase/carboxylesterase
MSSNLEFLDFPAPGEPRATVIWLHGLGADGSDFAPVVEMLAMPPELGVRFVLPHAPEQAVTINNGMVMRAWYDVLEMEIDRRADLDGVQQSVDAILTLAKSVVPADQPQHKLIIAGFSQGGVIAIHAAAQAQGLSVSGVIALSTYLPKLPATDLTRLKALPLFWGHGEYDPVVPLPLGEAAREALAEAGAHIEAHTYPIDHSVALEEIEAIGVWLRARLS